jgi:hypothetical protein
MKKYFALVLVGLSCALVIAGCSSIANYLNGADTSLKSTSLAAASMLRSMGITVAGTKEGSNWTLTPSKISGKVMSVVLPSNGEEDKGIVPFGSGRPDIAPANSDLYDFDLSAVTKLHNSCIGIKPGFKGGQANQILLMFGYFDVVFPHNGSDRTIRFVYGDTNPYVRGDKLLKNADGATNNKYYWYNTSGGVFVAETATRPSSPCANAFVRDFSDPIRPVMHYYMLGAQLRNCIDYDGSRHNYITLNKSVIEDNELSFTVDFDVANAVVFTSCTTEAEYNALSDEELIQKFDMKQNASRWSSSELYCSISFEATPKFK